MVVSTGTGDHRTERTPHGGVTRRCAPYWPAPVTGCRPGGTRPITPLRTTIPVEASFDLASTVLVARHGPDDPCWRFAGTVAWAQHSPAGPATVRLTPGSGTIEASVWGAGAEVAAASLPGVLGLGENPTEDLDGPEGDLVATLAARHPGFRLTSTGRPVDAALGALCGRGVSLFESARAWSQLVAAFGDDAPGPGGLRLPPSPSRLAAADPYELHVMGLDHGRADEMRRIASHGARLATMAPADTVERLRDIAGVGADVVEHVRSVALGDADALPLVDPHLSGRIMQVLGTSGAPDVATALDRYRPQRGRVVRLVELDAGRSTP